MANELGQYGITVNNVLPGFTNTNRLKTLISKAQNQKVSEEHITKLSTVPHLALERLKKWLMLLLFYVHPLPLTSTVLMYQ